MTLKTILRRVKYYLLSTRYPLNNKDSDLFAPFFIIGSGRSGTTLLRRILNSHSELFIPPETYEIGPSIQQFRVINNIGWNNLVKLVYANFEFNSDFHAFNMGSLKNLYVEVCSYDDSQRTLAHILNALYLHYRKEHKIEAGRWGDKTPLNTLYLQEIKDVFPAAKFIHVIRNPYDSIFSYVNSGIYKNIKDAAERWKKSIELACDLGEKYACNYFEIQYEKMVDMPAENIMNICKYLEIDYEKSMLDMCKDKVIISDLQFYDHYANVLKPISKDNIGKGLKNLSNDDVLTINNVLSKSNNRIIKDQLI